MFGKPAKPPATPPAPPAAAKAPAPAPAPQPAPAQDFAIPSPTAGAAARPAPRTEAPSMALADPLPNVRKSPSAPSLIAENMTIEGAVSAEGELHIDGVVRGEVRVSRLTIGDSGQIEGTITADTVEVRGKVIGAVTAKQIRLASSAHVDGDITHEQLAIEAGAFFQGRSLKFQRPAAAPAAKVAAEKPTLKEVPKPDVDLRPEHVS